MRLLKFAYTLLPVALGLALDLLWQTLNGPSPIIFLRVDVGTLLLLLGILDGIATGLGLAIWSLAVRRGELNLRREQLASAESHRRFVRRLDHEIKNPLTAIRAGLANLPDSGDAAVMRSVRTQVDRLAHLSADLRKLADLETQPLECEPVDLGELLDEVVDQAEDCTDGNRRRVHLTVPHAPWPLTPVPGDRDLLFLAIHNLVDNALKYSRDNDTVELRAFEDNANVVVEVADTGTGIPESELSQIWDELYRGQGARGLPGSGLGLALVRAVVERHGGTVSVRSREGQGTVFTVRLPLSPQRERKE